MCSVCIFILDSPVLNSGVTPTVEQKSCPNDKNSLTIDGVVAGLQKVVSVQQPLSCKIQDIISIDSRYRNFSDSNLRNI